MLLIGESPHVQIAIDIMKDQNFESRLRAVRAVDLSPNTYKKVLALAQDPRFRNQWSAKFTPGFKILTDWVQSILREYEILQTIGIQRRKANKSKDMNLPNLGADRIQIQERYRSPSSSQKLKLRRFTFRKNSKYEFNVVKESFDSFDKSYRVKP